VQDIERHELDWRRSSHSGGGNDCVEIAFTDGGTALRDSKDPFSGLLLVRAAGWRALLAVAERESG
jgi:hypothetical protein